MKRSPPPPPLRCIVSTVAQARNVVVVVMTEANSLARSSGILSSAAERRSITEETRCGILQLPSPFPLYTVCRPQGASSLLLPQRQKAERRTRFLPYPTSRLDAVVVFFNFAFSAAPLLSLSLIPTRYFVLLHTFHLVFFHCEMQPAEADSQNRKLQYRRSKSAIPSPNLLIRHCSNNQISQDAATSRPSSLFSLRPIFNLLMIQVFLLPIELSLCFVSTYREYFAMPPNHKLLR